MLLGLILLAIIFAAGFLFLHPPVWFPVAITSAAVAYDRQFLWTLWIAGILFLAAHLVLAWIVLRRKDAGENACSTGIRASWLAAVAMIAVEVALAAHGTSPLTAGAPRDFETIEVWAHQFAWNFRYAGPDGVFGRQDPSLIGNSNPLGLDPTDPHSSDDIVSLNEMHVPVNRNVILIVTSKDVIHSVSIESMRIGQDAIPGSEIPIWFKPVKLGTYEIVCAQLCGANHALMRATVVVDTDADYQSWLHDEEQLANPTPVAPAAPAAAAPAASAAPAGGTK